MAVAVEARRGARDMGTTCRVGVVVVMMAVVVVVEGLGEVLTMFTPSGWPWRR